MFAAAQDYVSHRQKIHCQEPGNAGTPSSHTGARYLDAKLRPWTDRQTCGFNLVQTNQLC